MIDDESAVFTTEDDYLLIDVVYQWLKTKPDLDNVKLDSGLRVSSPGIDYWVGSVYRASAELRHRDNVISTDPRYPEMEKLPQPKSFPLLAADPEFFTKLYDHLLYWKNIVARYGR